jgi:predicted O-methyltransferase YrrM
MLALVRRTLGSLRPGPWAGPLKRALAVEGQISADEVRLLFELARGVPPGRVIVEIGTYRGRSAVALALGSLAGPQARVYAIDPHAPFVGVFGGHFGPEDQAALYRNLTRAGVGHVVAVLCATSQAMARGWPERNVGLLWVDGDHSEAGVRGDYQAWRPHLAPGAVLAFHDADAPGVAALLADLDRDPAWTALGRRGRIAWFRAGCEG